VGWDVGTAKRKGKTVWRGGGAAESQTVLAESHAVLCWVVGNI
jgi:hypothetical protein